MKDEDFYLTEKIMMNPEISVILPVYNGEKYLREAIDSILNQTFINYEFIIVNDGSMDKSLDIIRSYKYEQIKLINQKNTGLAKALNNGIKLAKGRYIARMDQDDVSATGRLQMQFDFLENNPECVVVGSNAKLIDMNGNYLYTSSQALSCYDIKKILPSSPFFHSSTMFRKKTWSKSGGYYEKIKHHFEDMILWNNMAELGQLRNIENPLIEYRLVPTAMTNRSLKANSIMHKICNNILKTRTIKKSDLEILDKITKKKSKNWKSSNYYLRIGKVFVEKNFHRKKAFKNLILSIRYSPLNLKAWFNLILLFFPLSIIKSWKKSRGVL